MTPEPISPEKIQKKHFLSLAQTAKVPKKIANEIFDSHSDGGEEYCGLFDTLRRNERDTDRIADLCFVGCNNVHFLFKTAHQWIETFGKAKLSRVAKKTYTEIIEQIEDFDTGTLYCLVDYKSPEVCGLMGSKDDIREKIEQIEEVCGSISYSVLKGADIETSDGAEYVYTVVIALIPSQSLFLEQTED